MALILDTGPLYASLDRDDVDHDRCRELILGTDEALVVPAPVLVELDYWIWVRFHPGVLTAFLDDVVRGAYQVEELVLDDYSRVRQLCERYGDGGSTGELGFVDAAVVAVVERLGEDKLATLDRRRFERVWPRHVEALRLLPAD